MDRRRSIAHAETLRRAEGISTNGSHVGHLQQVHGKIRAAGNLAVAVALAKETAASWEEVEGSLWVVDLQSGYLASKAHYEVLPPFEGKAHILHALLVA